MTPIERAAKDAREAVKRLAELAAEVPTHQVFWPLRSAKSQTTRVQLPFGEGSLTRCQCGHVELHIPVWFGDWMCPSCGESRR